MNILTSLPAGARLVRAFVCVENVTETNQSIIARRVTR